MTYRQFNDIWLCTRADFQQQRYGGGTVETYDAADNAVQDYYIAQASRDIVERVLFQLPLPYRATLRFDAPRYAAFTDLYTRHGNSYLLYVGDEDGLLEVMTLTNGDGEVLGPSLYVLEPVNSYPKFVIRLKSDSNTYFTYTDTWEQRISIDGVWGYVPNYANAWTDSGIVIPAGGITAIDGSFTLATPADADVFSAGLYLQVGQETLRVTETNVTTGVVTVARGELGTTAAAHEAGSTINRFNMLRQIATETARYASMLYNKDRSVFDGANTTLDSSDILESVAERLSAHRRFTL